MTTDLGGPPKGGWARLQPELYVTDLEASLRFWRDALGFTIAYRRPEEGFVFLERDGAQIMLCVRNGRYEIGKMEYPLGQGAMFQIYVDDIAPTLAALARIGWKLFQQPREAWYRAGDVESGQRDFFVQDPDGYLLLIGQSLGTRPARGPA
jgi:catechol 2,3-dioxygenase-like lactoylglutathione lyase family enzyme